MLQGIIPPAGGEILCACARRILNQNLVLPRLPCIQPLVYLSPDLAQFFDMPGVLESYCLKDDEPLRVPAVLPYSCEFRGQRVDEVVPEYPAQHVIPPCGHDR